MGGLDGIVWHLNRIHEFDGEMAEAWKRAEQIVTYAIEAEPVRIRLFDFSSLRPKSRTDYLVEAIQAQRRKPSLRKAAKAFNAWAQDIPARLEIMSVPTKSGLLPEVHTDDDNGFAAWMLWRCFFVEQWWRLKRCPQCRKWFVDKTRNGVMVRCSRSCTDKWWTLARRREAHHHVPGSARKTKRRVRT